MAWKQYPAYRNSGVAWLGEVPAGWQIRKLRECGRIFGGLTPSMEDLSFWDGSIPWITPKDMKRPILADAQMHVTEKALEETRLPIVPPNSVLLVVRGMILARRVPIARTVVQATVNQDMKAIVPVDDIDPAFLVYLLESANEAFVPLIEEAGHGTKRLPTERWRQISFAFPAKEEQSVIVTYLDRETARIDALLAKKERLIALLREKRIALISRAVTEGLNPSAPMKDSGIGWLGDVPAHWEIKRLKYLATIQTGVAKGQNLAGIETVTLPYLRVANVQDGYLDLTDISVIEVPKKDVHRYLLQNGDVLMNEGGDEDKLGRGAVWNGEIDPCIHQNHVFAVRAKTLEQARWIDLITLSSYAKSYFEQKGKRTTNLASISSSNIRELPVMFPPEVERRQILDYTMKRGEEIDTAISMIRNSRDKLEEYRTTLISAAVTGKIDVRSEVPA
ncbi:MAG: restriction endonuclease subunit S [Methanospirillum sp.]